MSGSLATGVITNAGNSAIVANGTTAAGIAISHAQVGSANLSTLTTAELQALTAVSGLVWDSTSSSSALSYMVNTGTPNQVLFKLVLDESIGDFSVGNIGLLDANNTLYGLLALSTTATKVSSSTASGPGNRKTYNMFVDFSNAATITSFSAVTQSASSIPEVANETNLPAASSAPYDLYLVDQHTLYKMPCLAARYGSTWYFTILDSNTPELDGSINLPGMFDASVNPGDAVYFNGTSFVLASTANSIQNPPVGVKGYGDFLYPNGSVFFNSAGTYTTGTNYYCNTTNTTGNVVTTNTGCLIGSAINANELYIDIPTINKEILGSLTVKNLNGSTTLVVPNSGNPTVTTGLNISAGLTVGTGVLAAEGTSFNGNNGYSFIGDGNYDTGMFSPSDGILEFYCNSVEVVTANSSGLTVVPQLYLNAGISFDNYGSILWPAGGAIYEDSGNGDIVIRTDNGAFNYAVFTNAGGLNIPGALSVGGPAYVQNATAPNNPVALGQYSWGGNNIIGWRQTPDGFIEQWYQYLPGSMPEGIYGPFNFPRPFSSFIASFQLTTVTPEIPSNGGAGDNVMMVSASYMPTLTQFWVWSNLVAGVNNAYGFNMRVLGK